MPSYSRMPAGEFAKVNSQTGEPRLDILRRIMRSGEEIPKIDGAMIKILNNQENAEAIDRIESENKAQKIETNTGTIISSLIGKSPVFGGAGTGAGMTGQTSKGESLQCVYCVALANDSTTKPFLEYNQDDLKKALGKTKVDTSFENMMELDASWHWSAYWTAKTLKKKGYLNGNMTFHRGDAVMKSIYDAKTKAIKNSNLPRFSDDKWNPGDIWAVARGYNPKSLPTSSIQELNQEILKLLKEKKLIGISLKKITKDSGIRCEILNAEDGLETHQFKSGQLMVTFARKGSEFWRSQKGDIFFDKNSKMDVRTSSALTAPNVEIQLATARGGRAGWGEITQTFKKRLNKTVPSNNTLKTIAKDLNAKGEKSRYANDYYKMAKMVHPQLSKDEFMSGLSSPVSKIHSKIAAIYVVSCLVNSKGSKADLVVTDLVNFAGSKSDISSAYLKVYQ